MLNLNIMPIFKARGIEKPYTFLVKAGLSPHAATTLLNSKTRTFRLDHIELLCVVLNCEPNDLLAWTPDAGKAYAENNSLNSLKQTEVNESLKETMARMTYKEVKETARNLNQKESSNQ